jgi:HlyD family secretion protein
MKTISRRRALQIGGAVLLLALLVYAFMPDPVPVQTAAVTRGPLEVIVEEEGETRLDDRFVVTAPVAAFARRITLEVGDRVQAGDVLVRFEPPRSGILDPRAQAEATARVNTARAAFDQADIVARQAQAHLERVERLEAAGAATRQTLEQAAADAARALGARGAAQAEMTAALAAQRTATGSQRLAVESVVRAPAAGRVLAIHQRSEGHVMPGERLLELGDTEQLQVAANVLSQDAVRIAPGTRVILDQWGGDTPLDAVVSRVEPEGFTETSALGVEERRVTIRASITAPPEQYAGLGPGYRVLARFVIWSAPDVLRVPTAALFRSDDGWAVFVVTDGRAVLRPVTVGRSAGLTTQVLGGLEPGEIVIVHPGNEVEDGTRVG